MCQGLLDEPRLDAAVRAGDVYGLMIEHYASAGNFEQVYWAKGVARVYFLPRHWLNFSMSITCWYKFKSRMLC